MGATAPLIANVVREETRTHQNSNSQKINYQKLFGLLFPGFYSLKTKAKSCACNSFLFNFYLLKGEGPEKKGWGVIQQNEEKKLGLNSPPN